jgi:hypothetical protein
MRKYKALEVAVHAAPDKAGPSSRSTRANEASAEYRPHLVLSSR